MGDFGRVEKKFYTHPKALKARGLDPGSISLWLFANCWCRDHRAQGVIPHDVALELGSATEVKALLDSQLWTDNGSHYEFHDWPEWNSDMIRVAGVRSSAQWLVQDTLPDHPASVQQRLAGEVEKLIEEGATTPVLRFALRKWGEEPNARVTWLAYYVSDAIRQGERGIAGAIKQARRTWNMAPLAEFGYRWQAPDPPLGVKSVREVREFMQRRKSDWLDEIEASIGEFDPVRRGG